jgi:hypothetical protein
VSQKEWAIFWVVIALVILSKKVYTTLFKKYPTLFFPVKNNDGRFKNLIIVVGGGPS